MADIKIAGATYSDVDVVRLMNTAGTWEEFTQGGGVAGISAFASGEYTFTSDMAGNSSTTSTTYQKTISHGLGVIPDMILFYAPSNVAQTYSMLGMMWHNSEMAWRGSTYKCNVWLHGNSTTTVTGSACTGSYGIRNVTASQFSLKTYSSSASYFWRAGTYKWISIKF